MQSISHPFDLHMSGQDVNFLVEEMPESKQFLSDCLSSGTTFSTAATGGCFSSLGSFSSVGSVISSKSVAAK